MSRLQKIYADEVVPKLKTKFSYKNIHEIPKVTKIVLNMGLGAAVDNPKIIETAVYDLTMISGQKPVIRRSKKAIANFKLRENLPIGVSVTMRGERMYEFMDRLISVALPRVRDFKGISKTAFDGKGNYSLGITEQIVFPEVDMEKTSLKGLSVNIVTTAKNNEQGKALLEEFGFPFKK